MALVRRHPEAGLLHHSDRGSQYTSSSYQALLAQRGIQVSMSGKGDCYDNAAMESFFSSLKGEWTDWHTSQTRKAGAAVDLRVHQGVLQSPASPFHPWLSQPSDL
jgi:putative transposase